MHLELEAEKQQREAGMSRSEARRRAAHELRRRRGHQGGVRDVLGRALPGDAVQDVKYGARSLRRNPGFTGVVALTLGLGIGANTAVFSVVRGVLLRPLPYARGQEVVALRQPAPQPGHRGHRASR